MLKNKGVKTLRSFLEFAVVLKKKRLIRLRLKNSKNFSKLFVYPENVNIFSDTTVSDNSNKNVIDFKKAYIRSKALRRKKIMLSKFNKYLYRYVNAKFNKIRDRSLFFQNVRINNINITNSDIYYYNIASNHVNKSNKKKKNFLIYKWLLNITEILDNKIVFDRKDLLYSSVVNKYSLLFFNNFSYFYQQNELVSLLNSNLFDKFDLSSYINKLNFLNLNNVVLNSTLLSQKNKNYLNGLKDYSSFFKKLFDNRILFEIRDIKQNINIFKSYNFSLYSNNFLKSIFFFKNDEINQKLSLDSNSVIINDNDNEIDNVDNYDISSYNNINIKESSLSIYKNLNYFVKKEKDQISKNNVQWEMKEYNNFNNKYRRYTKFNSNNEKIKKFDYSFINEHSNTFFDPSMKKYGISRLYANSLIDIEILRKLPLGFFTNYKINLEIDLLKYDTNHIYNKLTPFLFFKSLYNVKKNYAYTSINDNKDKNRKIVGFFYNLKKNYHNFSSISFFRNIMKLRNFLKFYFSSIKLLESNVYTIKKGFFLHFDFISIFNFINSFFLKQRSQTLLYIKSLSNLNSNLKIKTTFSFPILRDEYYLDCYSEFYRIYFRLAVDFFFDKNYLLLFKKNQIYQVIKLYKKNLILYSFNLKNLISYFWKSFYFIRNKGLNSHISFVYFYYFSFINKILQKDSTILKLYKFKHSLFSIYNIIWINLYYNK